MATGTFDITSSICARQPIISLHLRRSIQRSAGPRSSPRKVHVEKTIVAVKFEMHAREFPFPSKPCRHNGLLFSTAKRLFDSRSHARARNVHVEKGKAWTGGKDEYSCVSVAFRRILRSFFNLRFRRGRLPMQDRNRSATRGCMPMTRSHSHTTT